MVRHVFPPESWYGGPEKSEPAFGKAGAPEGTTKEVSVKTNSVFIGIDVSKAQLDVAQQSGATPRPRWESKAL